MKLPIPYFKLARVYEYEDGAREVEIVPVTRLTLDTTMGRRGFLGTAVTVGTVLAATAHAQSKRGKPSAPETVHKADCEEAFAHLSSIDALVISQDGKTLASGSLDTTIKLWSLREGMLLKTLTDHKNSVYALAISPDGKMLASGSSDKTIKLWSLPEGESKICLTDLKAIPPPAPNTYSSPPTYSPPSHGGGTLTLPCYPSPIPPGKVCTCNCIPVRCQAHRLLHDDPVIRTMAEEILLLVGVREFEYMTWAADNAVAPALKARIHEVMNSISTGALPNPARWPSLTECIPRLDHSDEIVALMAAQMIRQQQCRESLQVDDATKARVDEIIGAALSQPWFMSR